MNWPSAVIENICTWPHRYVSVLQLARYVGVTRRTIYKHIEKGALKAVKIGGVVRIRSNDARVYCGEDRKRGVA